MTWKVLGRLSFRLEVLTLPGKAENRLNPSFQPSSVKCMNSE